MVITPTRVQQVRDVRVKPPEPVYLGQRGCKCDCLLCETDVHCLRKGKCKFYVE